MEEKYEDVKYCPDGSGIRIEYCGCCFCKQSDDKTKGVIIYENKRTI